MCVCACVEMGFCCYYYELSWRREGGRGGRGGVCIKVGMVEAEESGG